MTKKNTKNKKEKLSLRLDGEVSIVETDAEGNEKITPLEGDLVLRCLLSYITQGLKLLEKEFKNEDK